MFPAIQVRGGYCRQSIQFFNRVTDLSGGRKRIYDQHIRDLVTAGIWSLLDLYYIFAAPSRTTANTNLVSSSFTAVEHPTPGSSPSFTADTGYTGVASSTTVYLDTTFNPTTATSPNFTQNNAHISMWSNSNLQSSGAFTDGVAAGLTNASSVDQTGIFPKFGDGNTYYRINDSTGAGGVAVSDSRGHFLGVRNSSLAAGQFGFHNGVSQAITTATSGAPPNGVIVILANNVAGSGVQGGDSHQSMAFSLGAALTSTQAVIFYNSLHTLLQKIARISY